jgi:hypothetical protein
MMIKLCATLYVLNRVISPMISHLFTIYKLELLHDLERGRSTLLNLAIFATLMVGIFGAARSGRPHDRRRDPSLTTARRR